MADNLVIVESPAKAKTIEGFLGKDFTVRSSFGHVRDLVKNDKAIDVENDFAPQYEESEDKAKVVDELRRLAKKANLSASKFTARKKSVKNLEWTAGT